MATRELPYANATSGEKALASLQSTLEHFGCQSFGTMVDAEMGETLVQFKLRGRAVSIRASWRGYAQALLKAKPWTMRMQRSKPAYEAWALAQGRVAVCSVLRDWVKGQVTAIECGVLTFEAAFLPHMLLPSGERVIERIEADRLLPALTEGEST